METNGVVYYAKLKDGSIVQVSQDKTHYRAFNTAGQQVGEPFVKLGDLLAGIGGEIYGGQNNGAPGGVRPGQEPKGPEQGPEMGTQNS